MLSNPQGVEDLRGTLSGLFTPVKKESVVDWVEENVELPTGAITGKMQLKYTPYGREILERFGDKTVRHLVLCFATQLAKALALDTPIATPCGWTTVGNLREGDVIYGGDGKPCHVIKKTEVFRNRECYRVTFGSGDSIVADAGHLWKAIRRRDNRSGIGPRCEWREEIVTTEDLRFKQACPHRIPTAGPLRASYCDLPIAPYMLGVWLGDGSSTGARFWSDKRDANEIIKGIVASGYEIGPVRVSGKNTLRISIKALQYELSRCGLIRNKHIPPAFLRASIDQRMALLRGLMDTDGTCSKTGGIASFSTIRPRLRDDVRELVVSLGFKAKVTTGVARMNGKNCGACYKVTFHANDQQVFRLRRKQDRVRDRVRDNFRGHEIRAVALVPTVPVQCLAVDSEDHTFLAGRDMIPTHNTTLLIAGMLYRIARDPEDALWVMGNADQSRDFNKERLQPFVHLCRPVLDLVPRTSKGAINKNLWGFTSQHYLNMVLNFVGAGSATNLSSRPRGLILMDEVDKYYSEVSFDAGTIQLAEERQKTFHFPLAVKASSPTLATRMIWIEYQKTDMRKYWLPCPRCERDILLSLRVKTDKFGDCGLRWWHEHDSEAKTDGYWDMSKVRANAFYKCQECGKMIHDFERPMMLEEGIWKPSNLRAETGRYGYHLNSMYSILSQQTSLGNIAIQFLLAKGLRSELQNFINGWMAECWDESRIFEEKEVEIEAFKPADIPEHDAFSLMSIDVQEVGCWVLIRRFAKPTKAKPFGESWLLFADKVDSEADIKDLQKQCGIAGEDVVADMARKPNAVAKMIVENKWRGVWGSPKAKHFEHLQPNGTRVSRPYSTVKFRDPMLGTAWENRTFERARFVMFAKDAIIDIVSSLRFSEPKIWHVTANVNPDYAHHLNSRVKTMQKNKRDGRVEWVYRELHQRNHLADCENMVTVRALQRGLIVPPPETEEMDQ